MFNNQYLIKNKIKIEIKDYAISIVQNNLNFTYLLIKF